MCLYPRLIKNPKYKVSKKNKGIVPVCKDDRVMMIPVGCNRCMECRKKKSRDWNVRLQEEVRQSVLKGHFMTLTFSDDSLIKLGNIANRDEDVYDGYELDNKIATLAVRRFTENWRVQKKKSLRHWLITELGHSGTERLHLHGLIWTDEPEEEIKKFWKFGSGDTGNPFSWSACTKFKFPSSSIPRVQNVASATKLSRKFNFHSVNSTSKFLVLLLKKSIIIKYLIG